MSTTNFKKAWEAALCRALLASQSHGVLADTGLVHAAGLPIRSGLRAGDVSQAESPIYLYLGGAGNRRQAGSPPIANNFTDMPGNQAAAASLQTPGPGC